MIIKKKEEPTDRRENYQPDMLEFSQTTAPRQQSDDALLSAAEAASIDLLALLREQRDEENALLAVAERTFVEDVPPSEATAPVSRPTPVVSSRRGMSPWWLAAAVSIGFALGFAMPRTATSSADNGTLSHSTDTLQGRSLASGDVNTFLLVSL